MDRTTRDKRDPGRCFQSGKPGGKWKQFVGTYENNLFVGSVASCRSAAVATTIISV